MPAPDHLRLILHALGTGGTVEMAERVHEHTAGLQRQIDGLTAQIGQLAQVLAAECEISNPMEATCAAAVVVIRAQAAEIRRLNTLLEPKRAGIRDLIEASSLGTPEVVAARESVPVELAQAAVARAAELAGDDEDDGLTAVTTGDLMLAREAAASVALDHDPRAQTIALPEDDWDDEPGPAGGGITDPRLTEAAASVAIDQDRTGAHTAKMGASRPPSNDEIRAWCRARGIVVSDRGPIGKTARAKYDAAHREA